MAEGAYYRDAVKRCEKLLQEHGDKYMAFYKKVQYLCASLAPGGQLRIDDYVKSSKRDAFCDVVIVYECEQPYGDGEGLVYLSHDRQFVRRSTVRKEPLFKNKPKFNQNPSAC